MIKITIEATKGELDDLLYNMEKNSTGRDVTIGDLHLQSYGVDWSSDKREVRLTAIGKTIEDDIHIEY